MSEDRWQELELQTRITQRELRGLRWRAGISLLFFTAVLVCHSYWLAIATQIDTQTFEALRQTSASLEQLDDRVTDHSGRLFELEACPPPEEPRHPIPDNIGRQETL